MNSLSVLNTVSARQLQRDYKSVFLQANTLQQPIMVISNNQPQVIMLSPKTFERYAQSLNRQELWETIASIQADNSNTKEKEVEKDVIAAVKRTRINTYGKTTRRSR